MSPPGILYDLTYFVHDPLRTGIQRVTYEIARHWKARTPLMPAVVSPQGSMHCLPDSLFPLIDQYFKAPNAQLPALATRIQSLVGPALRGPQLKVCDYPALLNAEVFTQAERANFYLQLFDKGLSDRVFLVVYDLLPFLHPEWFIAQAGHVMLPYGQVLSRVQHAGFISAKTREDYAQRLIRTKEVAGPVLPLGSDGLGLAANWFEPANRHFSVVGTLEPRKNHAAILDAFERFWADGVDTSLTFVGRLGWLQPEVIERIKRLARSQPRFRWLDSPDDATVRDTIRSSRATLYLSRCEGFGLPPVESLALGVPVIVTADMPSIRDLPKLGQLRVVDPTPLAIERAVRLMLKDDVAARKCEEIGQLTLPRWSDLAEKIGSWIASHTSGVDLQRRPKPEPIPFSDSWIRRTARRFLRFPSRQREAALPF